MNNPKVGKYGDYAPKVCAITGKKLSSGAVGHPLGNGFYCKVNAKYNHRWTDQIGMELMVADGKKTPAPNKPVEKSEVSK